LEKYRAFREFVKYTTDPTPECPKIVKPKAENLEII